MRRAISGKISDSHHNKIKVATVKDEKSSGTAGGTATSGSFETRDLNTLVDLDNIGITISSNQFVLPSGNYLINASAPAVVTSNNKIKLRNITDATDEIIGTSSQADSVVTTSTFCHLVGRITLTDTKTFEIQHRVSTSNAAGHGLAVTFSVVEVYTEVIIQKI